MASKETAVLRNGTREFIVHANGTGTTEILVLLVYNSTGMLSMVNFPASHYMTAQQFREVARIVSEYPVIT